MPRTENAYSEPGDLLIGDLRLPSVLSSDKIINDAADEIDSILGQRYVLPLNLANLTNPADQLALKRVNNWLASGRLILAVAAAQEDTRLHAYGERLVNDALRALYQLELDGLEELPAEADAPGPSIQNLDATSGVESFYGEFWGKSRMWQPGGVS